jgi:hypothetical protein
MVRAVKQPLFNLSVPILVLPRVVKGYLALSVERGVKVLNVHDESSDFCAPYLRDLPYGTTDARNFRSLILERLICNFRKEWLERHFFRGD